MRPFFSIIIPTYNRGYCIGKCIETLLSQDFKNWELIIVDDGSADNTEEVIKPLCKKHRIKYIKLLYNIGVNKAKNRGAEEAKGEWLVFQDSDDRFTENALSILQELIVSTKYPLIFTSCIDLDGHVTSKNPGFEGFLDYRSYLRGKVVGEYLPTVRRDVFLQFKFDEGISGGENICWTQIAKDCGGVYISKKITRTYNNKGIDRLSMKKGKENLDRLARVFKRDVEVLGREYLKDCPMILIEKMGKLVIYSLLGFASELHKPSK